MKAGRGAIFIDRDGVINRSPGSKRYITDWKEFRFLPGVFPALRKLKEAGRKVMLVSNQAGVGRGLFTKAKLSEITRKLRTEVRRHGGRIDAVYYCTHTPERGCSCRKPKPGLVRKAAKKYRLDLGRCFMVGDNVTDIEMSCSAGCRSVLVLTGVTTRRAATKLACKPDHIAKDFPAAVRWILKETS